jgi:hypothetical protein
LTFDWAFLLNYSEFYQMKPLLAPASLEGDLEINYEYYSFLSPPPDGMHVDGRTCPFPILHPGSQFLDAAL